MFINLKVFADHSQKIPSSFLNPSNSKKEKSHPPLHKVMMAYGIDFFIVSSIVLYFSTMTSFYVRTFLPTSMAGSGEDTVFYGAIPFVAFIYYAIANFFNGGQSFGMYKLGFRTPVHSKKYFELFRWSAYSTSMLLSFGLLGFFTRNRREEFRSNDYLYDELISYKEFSPMNLLKVVESMEHAPHFEEEHFQDAA